MNVKDVIHRVKHAMAQKNPIVLHAKTVSSIKTQNVFLNAPTVHFIIKTHRYALFVTVTSVLSV